MAHSVGCHNEFSQKPITSLNREKIECRIKNVVWNWLIHVNSKRLITIETNMLRDLLLLVTVTESFLNVIMKHFMIWKCRKFGANLVPKCHIQPCRVSAYIHRREWDSRIRSFHFSSFLTFGHRLICEYVLGLCAFINDHFHYHLQPARRFVSHFHSSNWSFAITKSGQSHSSYWSFFLFTKNCII